MKIFITAALLVFCLGLTVQAKTGEAITIKVNGMVCDFCAQGVTKHFMKQKEVISVKVNLDTMTIDLVYKPGQSLTEKQLEKMVKKSGGYDYKGIVSKLEKKDKAL